MNRRRFLQLTAAITVTRSLPTCAQQAGTVAPILTRGYDNARSGANLHETVLTRASVAQSGIRKLFTIPVWGDARGTECQPLLLPQVRIAADNSVHDVLLLPNMANNVRAVDAATGAAIWDLFLGRPVDGSGAIDMHLINQHWGVLSTGVIDPETKRLYCVPWISADGTPQQAVHFMAVIDIAKGQLVCPLVTLAGLKDGTQTYSSSMRKQRSSLVLTNVGGRKTVFFASGTVLETTNGASGYVFAFDCGSNQFTATLATSQGRGAGIWMGGQGLAADASGFLYAATGNGSFNGTNDFGEAVIKIQYQPPAGTAKGWMKVADWWSPYSDAGRTGQNPQLSSPTVVPSNKMSGMSAPSAEMATPVGGGMAMPLKGAHVVKTTDEQGRAVQLVYPKDARQNAAWSDEDFGSAGGTLIEDYHVYLAGGKDGITYPVRTTAMGKTKPADFANTKANCAKLAAPAVWATASPGRNIDSCPKDVTDLNFFPNGRTRHMHSTPVQYWHPTLGLILFVGGENSAVHAWEMSSSGKMTYLAEGAELASENVTNSPGGMAGSFMTLSSNNNQKGTALLWCLQPWGDANSTVTAGRLIVYDPDPLNYVTLPNGSKRIPSLWRSQDWNINFTDPKFNVPVVSGGKVYVPNYSGSVDVYGE
ncbi:hypothetical protein [Terriglobus saanensis]|uniref:Pyrrolo-quinoline quinone repeat-containing protein n=1 Tax=Terriglobus saanensis (strain ATCC BAA-1853 / DSM 23119 / SP1PR4) TaxID=401053 RepID=E8V436_TERSS|nr:hypothetical protein [Terriglobus saanensis]ADV82527.1 hypothetical protein AciPR4_1720 [Terriglobus saanensis SP1PR4]